MDQTDAYWGYWQSHVEQARQHENLRAQASAIVVSAAGIILALAFDDGIQPRDAWAGGIVAILGLFGLTLTYAHSHKAKAHNAIAGRARSEVERLVGASLGALRVDLLDRSDRSEKNSRGAPRPLPKGLLGGLWMGMHVIVLVGGIATTAVVLF